MKANKINKIFFGILIILLFGCQDSPRTRENAINIKRIVPGMAMDSVVTIMGKPDLILIYPFVDDEYQFKYNSPSGYSGDFQIAISRKDSSVIRVSDGL